jgi:hypothetical protein
MKRDSWGGPNIMMWSRIGLGFKLPSSKTSTKAEVIGLFVSLFVGV